MPKQLELLKRSGLEIDPDANRSEPELWIRRFVIWSEPDVVLRQILLRPGLNIIWAPDPADRPSGWAEQTAPGHGGGKTLFCRLLRYCLGEDRFAPLEQREKIVAALPNGMVGADIMVDGTQWAVVRPIGTTRKHFAIRNTTVDEVKMDAVPTGMDPLLEAITACILSDDVAALVPGDGCLSAWPVALAWLARDQECRFDKPLDWRSSDSNSGSPTRRLSAQQHLDAVRALIGALNPEETKLRAEVEQIEARRDQAAREVTQRAREADRLRTRLAARLGQGADDVPPGRLAIEPLRRAAIRRLTEVSQIDSGDNPSDIEKLRSEADEARVRVDDLKRRLAVVDALIPEIEKLIARINEEFPGASVRVLAAELPVCEICEVPIDRALAEGCRLSHRLPDLDAAKRRMDRLQQEHTAESNRLQNALTERDGLVKELEIAQKSYEYRAEVVRVAERMHDARTDAWYNSRRLIDDVERFNELLSEHEQIQSRLVALEHRVQEKRDQAGSHRVAHAAAFSRLSHFFNAILGELIGPDATGRIWLDGAGLRLSVDLGGERSTAAIDSLKVIAFDLSAVCMSIEGRAHQPALLVHDSPREADLGVSIFHRLFKLMRMMEDVGSLPPFQYIITTTTSPPTELTKGPWLREILGGATTERLLRRDL